MNAWEDPVILAAAHTEPEDIEPLIMRIPATDYAKDLSKINADLANFYSKYQSALPESVHIPMCLKKTLKFNKLEFYCLTAHGKKLKPSGMDAKAIHDVTKEMVKLYAEKGAYTYPVETPDGFVMQSRNTYLNNGNTESDNHVYEIDGSDEFGSPTERRKANNEKWIEIDQVEERLKEIELEAEAAAQAALDAATDSPASTTDEQSND